MPIHEIPVFPQWTRSTSQGLIGTRKFVVSGLRQQLHSFLLKVCASWWPGEENAIPVMLQVGAFDEKLKFCGKGDSNLTTLPHYKETLVVVQYQYLFMKGGWPDYIRQKPYHPPGTTLALRVRGSGQFLTMPPGAFTYAGGNKGVAIAPNENCRIVIPLTEYHLTCDRLTEDQVPAGLKCREGTVNIDTFLGEKPETLLFDTWELDPSFAVSMGNHVHRHKLTVCLRCRDIVVKQPGQPGQVTQLGKSYVGWNHDYHENRWVRLMIKETENQRPRYRRMMFEHLFDHTVNPCNP